MPQESDSPARPARILIVDDEAFNVDYLEQELEAFGYATDTAANGVEALEQVAADPPDLVLLDVMMPDMDGITALRILKRDPETRLIPVVLMTALNALDDRVRGIEAGADDFLSKPVDDRELLARIRTALTQKRTIDETVGELRSTSEHLERYGSQERDVAVLVVEWRLVDATMPDAAVGFLGRRQREAAEQLVTAHGGIASESETDLLVAAFDGPDSASRSLAALEAAASIVSESSTDADEDGEMPVLVSAAVAAGPTRVGSTRTRRPGTSRWAFGVEGEPVERASAHALEAPGGCVVVGSDVAPVVSDRWSLAPTGTGCYVVQPASEDTLRLPSSRRVTTILVSDIVASTRTVERVGDREGGELLAAHERVTREELALFGGEEIDTAGDGVLASFDSAARAIRCALALMERVAGLGLTIRVGIHTGEIEEVDGKPRGIAMHIASRIAAQAAPGEILVAATTRELATGAGLDFFDRGEHTLKGVSEPKRLYAAREGSSGAGRRGTFRTHAAAEQLPAGLTRREVDVLRMVAVGLSDAEVAERLAVSVRTVNAHLRSIYRKAGVHSRAAAGRFAADHGLV
jgi:DNA-binding NarL/FixJ family response regulator